MRICTGLQIFLLQCRVAPGMHLCSIRYTWPTSSMKHVAKFYAAVNIGACRAVWVPSQDLATLYFMCNYGKCILSQNCALSIHLCVGKHALLYRGSSHLILMIWVRMVRNNPGNAQVCPGLQAPMPWGMYTHGKQSCLAIIIYMHVTCLLLKFMQLQSHAAMVTSFSQNKLQIAKCWANVQVTCHSTWP